MAFKTTSDTFHLPIVLANAIWAAPQCHWIDLPTPIANWQRHSLASSCPQTPDGRWARGRKRRLTGVTVASGRGFWRQDDDGGCKHAEHTDTARLQLHVPQFPWPLPLPVPWISRLQLPMYKFSIFSPLFSPLWHNDAPLGFLIDRSRRKQEQKLKPGEPAGWTNSKVSKLLQINKNAKYKYNSQLWLLTLKAFWRFSWAFNLQSEKWQ